MDKRLCDKDELIAAFNASEYGEPERSEEWTFPNKLAVQIVEDMPEVDAVEVVRCGDCKHFNFDDQAAQDADWSGRCRYGGRRMDVDDYCSRGIEKDNEDD